MCEGKSSAHQPGPDTLALQSVRNFGVYEAKKVLASFVHKKSSCPIRSQFEAVESGVVADSWLHAGHCTCAIELIGPFRRVSQFCGPLIQLCSVNDKEGGSFPCLWRGI